MNIKFTKDEIEYLLISEKNIITSNVELKIKTCLKLKNHLKNKDYIIEIDPFDLEIINVLLMANFMSPSKLYDDILLKIGD